MKAIALILTLVSLVAFAAEEKEAPYGTTANVSLTSDYNYRGQSQTDHQPAVQGGLDWSHPIGIDVGAWGSNVRYSDSPATLELDFYGGYTYEFSPRLNARLGVMYYSYFRGSEGNTFEFPLQFNWRPFKATVAFAPKWMGQSGAAWYFSGGWGQKVIWETSLGLSAGYSIFAPSLGFQNYLDVRLSVSREFLGVNWELAGVMVDKRQFSGADDSRVIFTAAKSF